MAGQTFYFNKEKTISVNFESSFARDVRGNVISLTKSQINMLRILIDSKDAVVSRKDLMHQLQGSPEILSRSIDNNIMFLRKTFGKNYFITKRAWGYMFTNKTTV